MNNIVKHLTFLFITYPAAIILGLALLSLRLCGRIKVLNYQRFPKWRRKMIVVSNHPSLLETILLPALFFRQYLVNPYRYAPWSTPDARNFYTKWYWFWARPRSVPILRQNGHSEARAIFQLKRILKEEKGIVIIFAEGGRTFRGTEFLYSKSGRKRIRTLKDGVSWLVVRTHALVLPVWVEGTENILPNHPTKLFAGLRLGQKAIIKIGEPIRFRATRRLGYAREVSERIGEALLELADEEE